MYSIEYFHARVKADIDSWPVGIQADYARILGLLKEFGPGLCMPYSRPLGAGLFELRPKGREGIGRAFYCFADLQRVVVLHALIKKTQATPKHEIRLARNRMKEVDHG